MHKRIAAIWLFLSCFLNPLPALGEGKWTIYTTKDGLIDNEVNVIFKDSQGYIWFGTKRGVSKFDGVSKWTGYTIADGLPSNHISSISEDRAGNIWLAHGSDVGATKYDGSIWRTYGTEEGLVNSVVNVIYRARNGNMWFGTSGGVSMYDEAQWLSYTTREGLAGNYVNSIYEDSQGNLWLATKKGASKYDGKEFRTFLSNYSISSIVEDNDGNMWFGTGSGARKFDGANWTVYKIYGDNLLSLSPEELKRKENLTNPDNIRFIFKDSEGNLWFVHPYLDMILPGTEPGSTESFDCGVSMFDGTTWSAITIKDGLATNAVRTIFEDRDGNLWFGHGTREDYTGDPINPNFGARVGGGVSMREFIEWLIKTREHGLSREIVTTIFKDRSGKMWLGHGGTKPIPSGPGHPSAESGGGVSAYDGRKWEVFTKKDGLAGNDVRAIFQDSLGNMWFGAYGDGVSKGFWQKFDFHLWPPFKNVWVISEDTNGNIWFGHEMDDLGIGLDGNFNVRGNISRYNTNWSIGIHQVGFAVLAIYPDSRGDVWFGGIGNWAMSGGLAVYDGTNRRRYSKEDGLARNDVVAIAEDKQGNIWVGHGDSGGVSRYYGKSWRIYTAQDGLASDSVVSIFRDSRGIMWFGTRDKGVSAYNGSDWKTYTMADGLASVGVFAIAEDNKGNVWFGHDKNGVTIYRVDRTPPSVVITSGPDKEITSNRVSFTYMGSDERTPANELRYSVWPDPSRPYPREPNPDDIEQWSKFSSNTVTWYFGLPDGEHTSMVRAEDGDLNISSPASRTFIVDTIRPNVLISSPAQAEIVGGTVKIIGGVTDSDLEEFRVEYAVGDKPSDGDFILIGKSEQEVAPGVLAEWDTKLLPEQLYTIKLSAVDKLRHTKDYSITVTLDNTPPIAKLIAPRYGSRLTKKNLIIGKVSDKHLDSYVLEYTTEPEPNTTLWRQIFQKTELLQTQETEVQINHEWEIPTIIGTIFIRLTAIDAAVNTDMQTVSVEVPEALPKYKGSEAISSDGNVSLYIPPRSLESDTIVTINRVPKDEIQPPPEDVQSLNLAYDIGPADLELNPVKPATLQIKLDGILAQNHNRIALFRWNKSKWTFLGGTVQGDKVTIGIAQLGRYALMEVESTCCEPPPPSLFTCQPRVFSPKQGENTTISFSLKEDASVRLKIYNLDGRLQRILVSKDRMYAGRNAILWDGKDKDGRIVPSSLYLIALSIDDDKVKTKTVVIQNRGRDTQTE